MTIKFNCPECNKQLAVKDEYGGKKARCPDCQSICLIPLAVVEPLVAEPYVAEVLPQAPVKTAASGNHYFIDTYAGQSYGPVSFAELTNWFNEGRITENCSVRDVSDGIPRPASHYFPQLSKRSSAKNQVVRGNVPTKQANIGRIFSRVNEVFAANWGTLVGATVVNSLLNGVEKGLEKASENLDLDFSMEMIIMGASTLLLLLQIFIGIGMTIICIKVAKGESTSLGDLFSGGSRYLPVLGFCLLILIPFVCFGFFFGLADVMFEGVEDMTIGIFLLGGALITLICLLVMWPCYYLVVDNKTTVLGSFSKGVELGGANVPTTLLLSLASVGIVFLGFLALCVGVFFAIAYVTLMWTTAYLMMTGQLR